MSNSDNKININETMEMIRNATMKILEPMKDGERITIQDLKDKVIFATQLPVSIVNGLVPMILHEYDGGTIESGRGGGFFKGGKIQRTDARPRCNECHQVLRKINTPED